MASEYSESSDSLDVLTPTVSSPGSSRQTKTTEHSDRDGFVAVQDDLTLGRELMMKEIENLENESASGSDGHERTSSRWETVPDELGE